MLLATANELFAPEYGIPYAAALRGRGVEERLTVEMLAAREYYLAVHDNCLGNECDFDVAKMADLPADPVYWGLGVGLVIILLGYIGYWLLAVGCWPGLF